MANYRFNVDIFDGLNPERCRIGTKAAHRRRRRKNLEEKNRWLHAVGDSAYG